MKLKKIASLMLAGIMAVSMLAGCKTADNGGNGGEGEGNVTPTSTTASVLRENLGGNARRIVTAVSNGDLDADLQEAVDTYYNANVFSSYVKNFDIRNDKSEVRDSELGKAVIGDAKNSIGALNSKEDDKNVTAIEVYAVNKSVSDTFLLKQLAEKINSYVTTGNMPDKSTDGEYDYDYEISASIVTADGYNPNLDNGVKFVAFAVTKVATKYV